MKKCPECGNYMRQIDKISYCLDCGISYDSNGKKLSFVPKKIKYLDWANERHEIVDHVLKYIVKNQNLELDKEKLMKKMIIYGMGH